MKTLLFCNLIPLKTGAYETLLAAVGEEFRKAGDEYVVVFAGEPIPPVAEYLRVAGVRWRILPGWSAPVAQVNSNQLSVIGNTNNREQITNNCPAGAPNNQQPITNNSTGEAVRPWAFVLPALRIIREERPDVVAVHFGNELPTLAACLLCKLTMRKLPRWIWEQDQQIQDPGRIGKKLSKISLLDLGVDRFLVVYEGGRQSMLKRGIPASKITVIHNSVAPHAATRPKGLLRKELGIGSDAVIFVTNGSLIPRKRIDFILQACALVGGVTMTDHAELPAWRLLIIGAGPERERLEFLAGDLGIHNRISFLGHRNDVRDILPECDIYLHASRAEACTYAVTESLAAGIPAVMLNAGAAREQIEDGMSGYVLDEADAGAFAACLVALMGDPVRRVEMGWRAQSRWEALFQVDYAARQYHALYTAMAKERRGDP